MQGKILSLAAPYIIKYIADVIEDALSPEGVIDFKDEILNKIISFIKLKNLPFKDEISLTINKMFDPEDIEEYGLWMINVARKHIMHTETKWDDLGLPLLDVLEKMCKEISPA